MIAMKTIILRLAMAGFGLVILFYLSHVAVAQVEGSPVQSTPQSQDQDIVDNVPEKIVVLGNDYTIRPYTYRVDIYRWNMLKPHLPPDMLGTVAKHYTNAEILDTVSTRIKKEQTILDSQVHTLANKYGESIKAQNPQADDSFVMFTIYDYLAGNNGKIIHAQATQDQYNRVQALTRLYEYLKEAMGKGKAEIILQ